MADGNGSLIQWNAVNWITVILMVAIGFYFSGMVISFIKTNLPSAKAE